MELEKIRKFTYKDLPNDIIIHEILEYVNYSVEVTFEKDITLNDYYGYFIIDLSRKVYSLIKKITITGNYNNLFKEVSNNVTHLKVLRNEFLKDVSNNVIQLTVANCPLFEDVLNSVTHLTVKHCRLFHYVPKNVTHLEVVECSLFQNVPNGVTHLKVKWSISFHCIPDTVIHLIIWGCK